MQEDQKTYKHHEKKLGKDASAENLAKDCVDNPGGWPQEAELASAWVWDSRIKSSELLTLAA